MHKLIALVDMDDTLCDYSGTLFRDHRTLASPNESLPAYNHEVYHDATEYPHLWHRTNLIRKIPGWWRNLLPRRSGFAVLQLLRKYEFEIHILTKASLSNPSAWKEKVEWCQEHVPDLNITVTRDKSLVYGKVLVDDYPEYIEAWLAHRPRGTVIMPEYPWNKEFYHPQVTHFDGGVASFYSVEMKIRESLTK